MAANLVSDYYSILNSIFPPNKWIGVIKIQWTGIVEWTGLEWNNGCDHGCVQPLILKFGPLEQVEKDCN